MLVEAELLIGPLSQLSEGLAALADVGRNTVNCIGKIHTESQMTTVCKLAEVRGVDPRELGED